MRETEPKTKLTEDERTLHTYNLESVAIHGPKEDIKEYVEFLEKETDFFEGGEEK